LHAAGARGTSLVRPGSHIGNYGWIVKINKLALQRLYGRAILGSDVSDNKKELAAMDQNDLPKEFFVPEAKAGMSGSYAQFRDEKGVRHIPIFRTHELGSAWVAGTKEQWKRAEGWDHPSRRIMLEHGSILLEKNTPSNIPFLSFGGPTCLDLEPESGKLFAPPDRQVLVGS
jgi:hypothetical protein